MHHVRQQTYTYPTIKPWQLMCIKAPYKASSKALYNEEDYEEVHISSGHVVEQQSCSREGDVHTRLLSKCTAPPTNTGEGSPCVQPISWSKLAVSTHRSPKSSSSFVVNQDNVYSSNQGVKHIVNSRMMVMCIKALQGN